ncbi:MAG TPA: hypothetical protein P5287_07340, partial [bacterium]|nr:hypothetical protein [bacterium]
APGETADDVARKLAPLAESCVEFGNCIGFAMLVKREVMDKIGYLDEAFGLAYFEDTDFSMRAKAAGYRCTKACGAYVYHHEHKSLDRVPWKEELFRKNKKIYEERWGRPLRIFAMAGDGIVADRRRLREAIIDIVQLARNECYIHLYIAVSPQRTKADLFRELGIAEMANIKVVSVNPALLTITALWRIITKRKKPYDLALAFESPLAKSVASFYPIHGCPAYCRGTGNDVTGRITYIKTLDHIIQLKKAERF